MLAYFPLIVLCLESWATNTLTFLLNYGILDEQCAGHAGGTIVVRSWVLFFRILACYHLHVSPAFFFRLCFFFLPITGQRFLCAAAKIFPPKIPLIITPNFPLHTLSLSVYLAVGNILHCFFFVFFYHQGLLLLTLSFGFAGI